ncbi:hypothetical protein [Amycolatopsis australiensis]|uniref:Uncharacterized protein n=1 Tax=Amycolatopsis australiensis TaxID=546364 RepID=A0A1K1RT93_9PSEU|nr:hypothetical protein [Amycolatopsis australiensis]SFW75045.1 hypothetical protein SAMN04489730_3877 [Amycolatopsis australiensis]
MGFLVAVRGRAARHARAIPVRRRSRTWPDLHLRTLWGQGFCRPDFSGDRLSEAELALWTDNPTGDAPVPVNLYNRALITQDSAESTGFDFFETEHDPASPVDRQVGVVNLAPPASDTYTGCKTASFQGTRAGRSVCLHFRENLLAKDRARIAGALPTLFWPLTCPRPAAANGVIDRGEILAFNPTLAYVNNTCAAAEPVPDMPGIRVRIDAHREPVRIDFASPPPSDPGKMEWEAKPSDGEAIDVSYALITEEAVRQNYQFLPGVLIGLAAAVFPFAVQTAGRIRRRST